MAKIVVTLKDPDTMYDAIREHVDDELAKSELPEDEQEALKELRIEKYNDIIGEFFEYGEYLSVEFDTKDKTATVLTAAELERRRNR